MIVGTVREIKNHEYRVGLTPESVHELSAHGHRVLVETGAGEGIGAPPSYVKCRTNGASRWARNSGRRAFSGATTWPP